MMQKDDFYMDQIGRGSMPFPLIYAKKSPKKPFKTEKYRSLCSKNFLQQFH
jgi:hypothetical protein